MRSSPIERAAHAGPFIVRQRRRGDIAILRREDEIGAYLAVRGIGSSPTKVRLGIASGHR